MGVPVPVLAVAEGSHWGAVQELRARSDVDLVVSPRHAMVLLVAGPIPTEHWDAVQQLHDQLPHPRGVLMWNAATPGALQDRADTVSGAADDLAAALTAKTGALWADPVSSSVDLLADREPNEWRGVGPYGQGGEGMMGGTPYGRPMAMTGDDRDGLALDQLDLRIGPYVDALPGGLVAEVVLQGEVVQHAELSFQGAALHGDHGEPPRPTTARALTHWLTHALHVHGLDAHAARAAHLAVSLSTEIGSPLAPPAGDDRAVRAVVGLRRSLRWTGLAASLRGVGPIDGVDSWDRWTSRLDRLERAVGAESDGTEEDSIELDDVADAIAGLTWTDAVSTIVSCNVGRRARVRS